VRLKEGIGALVVVASCLLGGIAVAPRASALPCDPGSEECGTVLEAVGVVVGVAQGGVNAGYGAAGMPSCGPGNDGQEINHGGNTYRCTPTVIAGGPAVWNWEPF
jgi:hypothetical protein